MNPKRQETSRNSSLANIYSIVEKKLSQVFRGSLCMELVLVTEYFPLINSECLLFTGDAENV